MLCRNLILGCAIGLCVTSASLASVSYSTAGSGSVSSFTPTEVGASTNIWDIALTATGSTASPYFTVTISGTSNAVIRNLNVVSSDSGKVVKVSIASSVKRIENIHQTGGAGELWCELIRPSEEIGETSRGGEIIVNRIVTMDQFRDLTAAVTVSGSSHNSESITSIVAGRDILNSITVRLAT